MGDTGVLGFWDPRRKCVFDVHFVETNADTYAETKLHKLLNQHDWLNTGKYLGACIERRRHFMHMVFLVDGLMGEGGKLATKGDRAYLETCVYVRAHLSLNLERDFSLIVRGPRRGRPQTVILMPTNGVEASRFFMQGV